MGGNLRTLWYRYIKPVLDGVPGTRVEKGYKRLTAELANMVFDGRLLCYSDLDLTDESWEQRRIGGKAPHIIVYAEQSAWMRDLRRVHEKHDVTVVCWEGCPSGITSEYTARHVLAALPQPVPAHLISLTDWDPAGDIVMDSFQRHLEVSGLDVASNHRVITPAVYTEEERQLHAYPLPRRGRQATVTERWVAACGGLDGQPLGLSSEIPDWSRLEPLVTARIEELHGTA